MRILNFYLLCPFYIMFLNCFWIVSNMEINPHQAGNTKDIYEINNKKNTQQTKGRCLAPSQIPVEKRYKKEAKPSCPDIGNKHGSIIVARLREIVKVTFGTTFQHIKRPYKCPASCFKHISLLTAWTFQVNNTVRLCSFFKN